MSESWQIVAGGLGGLTVITSAYLYITKLILKSSLLEMDKQHREWCIETFVTKEVLKEKVKYLEQGA